MLSPDRLTVKAAEAIQAAAATARQGGHAEIHGVHLLDALLAQEEGIVVPILQKLEVPVGLVHERAREALERMARVEGGADPGLARDLRQAMDVAESAAQKLGDEYVSTEHLLIGLTEEKDDAGRILRDAGATRKAVEASMESVRGSHRVTDEALRDPHHPVSVSGKHGALADRDEE